jgi:hypothetical protein
MLESENPVLGKRTWSLSIALATRQVLNRRNCSKRTGVSEDAVIGASGYGATSH